MSGKLQFYMWRDSRKRFQQRHGFYCEQVKTRIFSQFENMEAETDAFLEKESDRLRYICDDPEEVLSSAEGFYSQLLDLRKQTILGALAGMYHQWEKDLRYFIEAELRHDGVTEADALRLVWKSNVGDVFDILAEFGWNCREQRFFSQIEACRQVVNVYKHGKGPALERLAERFPEYLDGLDKDDMSYSKEFLDYEWLSVTPDQFNGIAEAITTFWNDFPDRLVYILP